MSTAKFIFGREFPATPNRIVPLEKAEPVMTVHEHEQRLETAIASARAEAFREGKTEAEGDETARLAEAMEQVARMLDQVRHELDDIQAKASEEAIRFGHDFGRKLADTLMDQAPMAGIEQAARAIFDDLRGQPHVAVRLAPALLDAAKEKLGALARERGFEGRLIVMGEPEIALGDVRIEWADGGVIRDRARVEQQVAAGVERALAARTQS